MENRINVRSFHPQSGARIPEIIVVASMCHCNCFCYGGGGIFRHVPGLAEQPIPLVSSRDVCVRVHFLTHILFRFIRGKKGK